MRWKGIVLAVAIVLLVTGGTGAALCKLALNCHIRRGSPSIADYQGQGGGTMTLPQGFTTSTVVSGLEFPTDFAFFPDGRIVIAEKNGLLRLAEGGRLSSQPLLDLTADVNKKFFRGIMDVTVDPAFPTQPYVYVVYTRRGAGADSPAPTSAVVSRFRVEGDVALRESEEVLLGGRAPPDCRGGMHDCLPSRVDHVGADIVFGPDGILFVSTGDGGGQEQVEATAFLAQDPDSLAGKILRVDRNGRGLADNPFWNGDPDANRSKVWALGFRNPFRMTLLRSPPDTLIVADVGWQTSDELDLVSRRSNHGWPCFEGLSRTPAYRGQPFCTTLYEQRPRPSRPWVAIRTPRGGSVTGGVVLPGGLGWPPTYTGRYLFGDWLKSDIFTVPRATASTVGASRRFAGAAAGPVAFAVRPGDGVYYLALNVGELRLIAYRS